MHAPYLDPLSFQGVLLFVTGTPALAGLDLSHPWQRCPSQARQPLTVAWASSSVAVQQCVSVAAVLVCFVFFFFCFLFPVGCPAEKRLWPSATRDSRWRRLLMGLYFLVSYFFFFSFYFSRPEITAMVDWAFYLSSSSSSSSHFFFFFFFFLVLLLLLLLLLLLPSP